MSVVLPTVLDGDTPYFALFNRDDNGDVFFSLEKFGVSNRWWYPLVNLDACDKTCDSDLKHKPWFTRNLQKGARFVQHPLRNLHFTLKPGTDPVTNVPRAKVLSRPKLFENDCLKLDAEIRTADEAERRLSEYVSNFVKSKRTNRPFSETRLQCVDGLSERLRRQLCINPCVVDTIKITEKEESDYYRNSDDSDSDDSNTSNFDSPETEIVSETDDDDDDLSPPKKTLDTFLRSLNIVSDRFESAVALSERLRVLSNWTENDWNCVRILGYIAACAWKNKVAVLNDDVEKLFSIKPPIALIRTELTLLSEKERYAWSLSVGQLICLNRLFQYIDYHHIFMKLHPDFVNSSTFFKEWHKRVFQPAENFLQNCGSRQYTDTNLFIDISSLYATATLFDSIDTFENRCTKTEFESLTAWMRYLSGIEHSSPIQKEFILYLYDSATRYSFPFVDCLLTGNQIRELTRFNKITTDIVQTLAIHFPNTTYVYGCTKIERKKCLFLLVNFPIFIRYAVARYFIPSMCTFVFDLAWTTFERLQFLEYTLSSSLAYVYEESLDNLEFQRKNHRVLHLLSTDVSPNLAYPTNNQILIELAKIPTGFFSSTVVENLVPYHSKFCEPRQGVPYVDIVHETSNGSYEWRENNELIKDYKECLKVVRSTLMHTYWGAISIYDIFSFELMEPGNETIPVLVVEMNRCIEDLNKNQRPKHYNYDKSVASSLIFPKFRNNAPCSQRRVLYLYRSVVKLVDEKFDGSAEFTLKNGLSKSFYFLRPSNAIEITTQPKDVKLLCSIGGGD